MLAAFALEARRMTFRLMPARSKNETAQRRIIVGLTISVFLITILAAGCSQKQEETAAPKPAGTGKPNRTAVIETNLGTIKFELFEDQAPRTAENFRLLAERGFYNGLTFHRAMKGFMIQGGDPNGNGTGGQTATGGLLPNEINRTSPLYQGGYQRGMVAMANKGRPETASSQFFIMHQTYPLQPNYTIFGKVTEGMNVVDQIATAPTTPNASGEPSVPVNPVKMNKVYVQ